MILAISDRVRLENYDFRNIKIMVPYHGEPYYVDNMAALSTPCT